MYTWDTMILSLEAKPESMYLMSTFQKQAMLDKMADFDERLARMEERHQGELRVQHEQVRHGIISLYIVLTRAGQA
jgi:hypothetical protein